MHFPEESKELTFLILNTSPKLLFFAGKKKKKKKSHFMSCGYLTYKSNKVTE